MSFTAYRDLLDNISPEQVLSRVLRAFKWRAYYPLIAPMLRADTPEMPPADFLYCFNETAYAGKSQNTPRIPDSINDPFIAYTFHAGAWALELAHSYLSTGEHVSLEQAIASIHQWLNDNPPASRPGWEPYPTSRRLINWSRVHAALTGITEWDHFWRSTLAPSLHRQTRFLSYNLEKDLLNNHLIANYRALAWTGLLFPGWRGAEKWRTVGLNGLWREMRRQVLPDGVHNERSISYHVAVLQDLLETWWLAKCRQQEIPPDVEPALIRMLDFLADVQAPDGSYPMINDSVPGYPVDPRSVLLAGAAVFNRGGWQAAAGSVEPAYRDWFGLENQPDEARPVSAGHTVTGYPEAGFAIIRPSADDYVFFNAGRMSPEYLPGGHGHAGALSIVLYGAGLPLIVDPGVYSYHDTQWRATFRGTAAHSTITVDGRDQCDLWGRFRAAFPANARLTEWSDNRVSGTHDGYTRLSHPVTHRREITALNAGKWRVSDQLTGSGTHDFDLSYQLAPGAEIITCERGQIDVRWPHGITLHMACHVEGIDESASIKDGWVSTGWYQKERAPQCVFSWRSSVPVTAETTIEVHT